MSAQVRVPRHLGAAVLASCLAVLPPRPLGGAGHHCAPAPDSAPHSGPPSRPGLESERKPCQPVTLTYSWKSRSRPTFQQVFGRVQRTLEKPAHRRALCHACPCGHGKWDIPQTPTRGARPRERGALSLALEGPHWGCLCAQGRAVDVGQRLPGLKGGRQHLLGYVSRPKQHEGKPRIK